MFTLVCVCVCMCVCFNHLCFGSLSSDDTNLQDLSVYLGKTALNETDADKEQKFTVEKLIVHKQYNDTTYNNDIGVCVCVCVCVRERESEREIERERERDKELFGLFVCRTHGRVSLEISALLRIKSRSGGCAAKSASARTACLPPPHTRLPAGIQCSIAGYGRERFSTLRFRASADS